MQHTCLLTVDMTCGWEIQGGRHIHENTRNSILKERNTGIIRMNIRLIFFPILNLVYACFEVRWDEMGRYDVPASIDYVLNVTGQSKLAAYFGYSLGCSTFYIAAITQPRMNEKVELMVALGPTVSVANLKNFLRYLAPFANVYQVIICFTNLCTSSRALSLKIHKITQYYRGVNTENFPMM